MARILVVDDDEMVLSMFKDVIKLLGHEVIALDNAKLALEYLSVGHVIDLLITDVVMPNMDGQELVNHILDDNGLTSFPIIMISGEVFGRDLSRILESERVTFIQKPIRVGDLMAAINVRINMDAHS